MSDEEASGQKGKRPAASVEQQDASLEVGGAAEGDGSTSSHKRGLPHDSSSHGKRSRSSLHSAEAEEHAPVPPSSLLMERVEAAAKAANVGELISIGAEHKDAASVVEAVCREVALLMKGDDSLCTSVAAAGGVKVILMCMGAHLGHAGVQ